MRLIIAAVLLVLAVGQAEAQTCFRDCLAGKITSSSDDLAIKDASRECRESCENAVRTKLETDGFGDKLKDCKAEPLSVEDFRKVRAASPSYYVQANVFVWEAKNPFPDRVLTKIDVSAQNLDLNEFEFTGTGLIPPSGSGAFVIPSFFDGYPAVRFAGKIRTVWACTIK